MAASSSSAPFRVDGPNGERHVLRVQRTDGPTATMVGSELAWLLALGRDTDLAVPQPVANRFGDPIKVAAARGVRESRTCVLSSGCTDGSWMLG